MTNSGAYYDLCCVWVETEARGKTGELSPSELRSALSRLSYWMQRESKTMRWRSLEDTVSRSGRLSCMR